MELANDDGVKIGDLIDRCESCVDDSIFLVDGHDFWMPVEIGADVCHLAAQHDIWKYEEVK